MIAYEELERALARWKSRRSSGPGEPPSDSARPHPIEGDTRTPMPPEHTGEIDLVDAVVEDA
jgi:hypothetical protein